MKKITSFFLALAAFCTVYAQNEFDTAIQNSGATSSTTRNLFTSAVTAGSSFSEPEMNPIKKGISMMPSAGSNNIKVHYNTTEAGEAVIVVLDENGKQLLTQNAVLTVGKNSIVINNFSTLNEGTYSIKLIGKDTTYTSSFIVWK